MAPSSKTPTFLQPRTGNCELYSGGFGLAASRWYTNPLLFEAIGVTALMKNDHDFFARGGFCKNWDEHRLVGTVEYRMDSEFSSPLTTPDALTLQSFFAQMVQARVAVAVMEVSRLPAQ